MKCGSLFSGAGLGDLGWMMAGFDVRWQVEIDDYCRKILDLRFPEVKKYGDIKEVKGAELEPVDIVVGGFPCQPFSVAGKQRGTADDRNLWPEMLRVVKEVRPDWVVGENVSGIIPIYLDTVLADLEAEGYATRTFVFPAHALGANHRRERIWIVGYAGLSGQTEHEKQTTRIEQSGKNMGESEGGRLSKRLPKKAIQHNAKCSSIPRSIFASYWQQDPSETATKPGLGRVAHGVPRRVDRLKALGNGQVVAATFFIGQQIMEFEKVNAH